MKKYFILIIALASFISSYSQIKLKDTNVDNAINVLVNNYKLDGDQPVVLKSKVMKMVNKIAMANEKANSGSITTAQKSEMINKATTALNAYLVKLTGKPKEEIETSLTTLKAIIKE